MATKYIKYLFETESEMDKTCIKTNNTDHYVKKNRNIYSSEQE